MKRDISYHIDAAVLRLKVLFHDLEHSIAKDERKPTEEEMANIKKKVFELALGDSISGNALGSESSQEGSTPSPRSICGFPVTNNYFDPGDNLCKKRKGHDGNCKS